MLDEDEFEPVLRAYLNGTRGVKLGRKLTGQPLTPEDEEKVWTDVASRHREITGVSSVDPREILHHRLSLLGPPCAQCGKELRSPRARKCTECVSAPPPIVT
jgi:hypothetical protein